MSGRETHLLGEWKVIIEETVSSRFLHAFVYQRSDT